MVETKVVGFTDRLQHPTKQFVLNRLLGRKEVISRPDKAFQIDKLKSSIY
jgi:hypothetical protein